MEGINKKISQEVAHRGKQAELSRTSIGGLSAKKKVQRERRMTSRIRTIFELKRGEGAVAGIVDPQTKNAKALNQRESAPAQRQDINWG